METVCVRQDGCSLPLTRGYTTTKKPSLSANLAPANESVGYHPPTRTQPGLMVRTAAGFGFPCG